MKNSGCVGERDYIKPEKARVKKMGGSHASSGSIHGSPGKYLKISGTHKASYTAVPRAPGRK